MQECKVIEVSLATGNLQTAINAVLAAETPTATDWQLVSTIHTDGAVSVIFVRTKIPAATNSPYVVTK
jgi:hypothetical protein